MLRVRIFRQYGFTRCNISRQLFGLAVALCIAMQANAQPNSLSEPHIPTSPLTTNSLPHPVGTVTMGVHNFPPDFVVSTQQGTCGGSGVERTRKILASAGLKLKTVCVTPARMYVLLQRGEIDFSINIKSTKALLNNDLIQFADPAYSDLQLVLYSHSAQTNAPRDNSIAAIRSFDYQGERQHLAAQAYRFVDLPDATSAIDLFLHQRTQHLITYEGPFKAYLAMQPAVSQHWQRKPLATIPTHYVISTQSPALQILLPLFSHYAADHHCQRFVSCITP